MHYLNQVGLAPCVEKMLLVLIVEHLDTKSLPEPQLIYVLGCDGIGGIDLDGYPPWQMRLSEFWWVPLVYGASLHAIKFVFFSAVPDAHLSYGHFVRGLCQYNNMDSRFGT